MNEVILEVKNLKKYFPLKSGFRKGFHREPDLVKAVNDVSLTLKRGETYGLVGETGSGKTTLGRTILKLIKPTDGIIRFEGQDISTLNEEAMRPYRQKMQIVFQDPFTSLNPRRRIGAALMEPLAIHGIGNKHDRERKAFEILEQVGLLPEHFYRFPHEFSGGQLQRIGLARALIQNPDLLICDEPVSALDVSVQAQILNLLMDIQNKGTVSCLFIAHDLSVVKYISTRVGVMYLGVIVEEGPANKLFSLPLHPYTQALISAVPDPDPRLKKTRIILEGEPPSPINTPSGCVFYGRCNRRVDMCRYSRPALKKRGPDHYAACHCLPPEFEI